MPSTAEIHDSADFFLPEFIQKFLPDRNSLESILDPRYFTRERHLTLEVTLALLLNMVRPGERVGYQKVIDRFFSDTGLAFAQAQVSKPPDKAAFNRARKKIPPEVCQILFARPPNMPNPWPENMPNLPGTASGSTPSTPPRKTYPEAANCWISLRPPTKPIFLR